MKPKFRRFNDGRLVLDYTEEAKRVKRENSDGKPYRSLPPQEVHRRAVMAVKKRGGDVEEEVLGDYVVQFGAYRGQNFRWMLENCLGYTGWLCDNMRHENLTSAPLSVNKDAFRKYAQSFAECREVIARKAADREANTRPSSSQSSVSQPSASQPSRLPPRISSLMTGQLHGSRLARKVQTVMSKASTSGVKPNLSVARGLKKPAVLTSAVPSKEACCAEETSVGSSSKQATPTDVMTADPPEDFIDEAELVAVAEMVERQQQRTSASDLHFQAYLLEGLARWNEDRAAAAVSGRPEHRMYNRGMWGALNQLSTSVLGEQQMQPVRQIGKYTGELIGVEYLFSQTGKVLQDDNPDDPDDSNNPDDSRDPDDGPFCDGDNTDEGFVEEVEDSTIATAAVVFTACTTPPSGSAEREPGQSDSQQAPSRRAEREPGQSDSQQPPSRRAEREPGQSDSQQPPSRRAEREPGQSDSQQPPSEEMACTTPPSSSESSVCPDNIEGFEKVDALASFLVSLCDIDGPVNNTQADRIAELWRNLLPYDQQPTAFAPRYTTKQKGRFKASKSAGKPSHAGVESTKRCFLGSLNGPAQWPDCNRYVEAVVSKLCDRHPTPVQARGRTTLRWTLVCRDYKSIKDRVMSSAKVLALTDIQLFDINQHTLLQWYNKREKRREREMLQQGIRLAPPTTTTPDPLPPAKTLPEALPQVSIQPLTFSFPVNTTGQAQIGRGNPPPPSGPTTVHVSQPVIFPAGFLPPPQYPATMPSQTPAPSTSMGNRSRYYYLKRKQKEEDRGMPVKFYKRQTDAIRCRKCGLPRNDGGHKQYFGNWFCPGTETKTYEEWKAELQGKGYGQKKPPKQ